MNSATLLSAFLKIALSTADVSAFSLFSAVALIFGLIGIFRKCGIKWWLALIPCVRDYHLGRAAGREDEGRFTAVMEGVLCVIAVLHLFAPRDPDAAGRFFNFLSLVSLVVSIVSVIYMIRVYIGLNEVFGQKPRWMVLWVFLEALPAIIFGWDKQLKPQWTVSDLENETANYFSNQKAAVMDQGLTVNLEERDIHMYIQPGHMVLLLGGSGAGKTTYLNAVNGYEKAKAEVVLNGRNMYKEYKDMQYEIGFVPQLDLMRGSDTVYRTLMDAAALRLPTGFSRAERQARVEEVMKIFGLTPVKGNLVSKLSGGQRKRLSIAMEFISNPTLFILDEPDSGLDGVMARELFLQLRKIADQGKIIIVITHTPDRVIDLFDDVIVLAKDAKRTGRLAWFGPIDEARAFFGKEKMEEIVKSVNREEEGGEGRADEFILKYAEVQHV